LAGHGKARQGLARYGKARELPFSKKGLIIKMKQTCIECKKEFEDINYINELSKRIYCNECVEKKNKRFINNKGL
jgi:hypothetical protein